MAATARQDRSGAALPWWQKLLVAVALIAALWAFGGIALVMAIEGEDRTVWLRAVTDESVVIALIVFLVVPAVLSAAAAWGARRVGALFPAVLIAGPAVVLVYHWLLITLGTGG